jgi:hypothetical protein
LLQREISENKSSLAAREALRVQARTVRLDREPLYQRDPNAQDIPSAFLAVT